VEIDSKVRELEVRHLATGTKGGAGLAALRAHECLESIGIASHFVSPSRSLRTVGVQSGSLSRIVGSQFTTVGQRLLLQRGTGLMTPISFDFLKDLPLSSAINHVHAFYNLLSVQSLISLARSGRLVMTMHDQRLITGGCHYSRSCQKYLSKCEACPQARRYAAEIVKRSKRDINKLLSTDSLRIICPSNWIANMVVEVEPQISSRVYVVKNPIPTPRERFDRESVRSSLGIGQSERIIGYVSTNLSNPLKGGTVLAKAISLMTKSLRDQSRVLLVGSGKFEHNLDDKRVMMVRTDNTFTVEDYLLAMDVLVVPSVEDNLPNVIGESLMVGTPVIGSDVGGIPEVLNDFDMPVFTRASAYELSEILCKWPSSTNRQEVKKRANSTFSYKVVAEQLLRIYRS